MSKKNLVVAVESAVNAFDAILAEQASDITKCADMLVSVEKWESDAESTQAGIGVILHDVLMSQGDLALGWYDAVRLAFSDAYGVARGASVSDEAKRKAWSRAFGLTSLEKPKAQSDAAIAKAEQREKSKAEQEKLLASVSNMSYEEVREQAKGLYEQAAQVALNDAKASKAKSDEAKRLLAVADKMIKAEAKAVKDEAKNLKASIRDALSKCNNVHVLGEVLMMLQAVEFDDVSDDDTDDLF